MNNALNIFYLILYNDTNDRMDILFKCMWVGPYSGP